MQDTAAGLADVAIAVFAVTSMLSVGLGNRLREIIEPLRHPRGVVRALVANFVLVPALAYLTVQLLPLEQQLEHGVILIAVAAGAPFLIKLSAVAGSHLGLTATLLVLLLPVTIVYMPVVVPLLLPGTGVSLLAIASPLVVTMLLPLAVGLLVSDKRPPVAGRLQPILARASTWALIILILAVVLAYFDAIVSIGWQAALAAVIIVAGAFLIGYLLGGFDPDNREILGLGTGQRNIAAASVVASQSLGEPDAIIMIIAVSLIGLAVLFPIARVLRRRERQRHSKD